MLYAKKEVQANEFSSQYTPTLAEVQVGRLIPHPDKITLTSSRLLSMKKQRRNGENNGKYARTLQTEMPIKKQISKS